MERLTAWVGLGSNLGDSAALLRSALRALDALPGTRLQAVSPFYRSPALTAGAEAPPQPDYCNAVAALRTAMAPGAMLAALLTIEQEHGRMRSDGARWQARRLDLDLLCVGRCVAEQPGLNLPHPEWHRRAFVLVPWADLAPATAVAGQGTVAVRLASLDSDELSPWTAQSRG